MDFFKWMALSTLVSPIFLIILVVSSVVFAPLVWLSLWPAGHDVKRWRMAAALVACLLVLGPGLWATFAAGPYDNHGPAGLMTGVLLSVPVLISGAVLAAVAWGVARALRRSSAKSPGSIAVFVAAAVLIPCLSYTMLLGVELFQGG